MGMRLARGLDGACARRFHSRAAPRQEHPGAAGPRGASGAGAFLVAGALQAEAHPRAQARAISAARRSFGFIWNVNHVGTTIRQRLVAGLRLRPVRAGLHAGLRRARGHQSGAWRGFHGGGLRGADRGAEPGPAAVGGTGGGLRRRGPDRRHHRLPGAQAAAQAQRASPDSHDRHHRRGHHPEQRRAGHFRRQQPALPARHRARGSDRGRRPAPDRDRAGHHLHVFCADGRADVRHAPHAVRPRAARHRRIAQGRLAAGHQC